MTWSSYPQHQLMVEGFKDFFKRKKKSSATYPASELTTIVNLISNLAKKFSIETDTGAIVDEFEAMLKSQNIDLQEQDDRLMIGADLNLTLDNAPKLKKFMTELEKESPQALQLLVKALEKGAFNISDEQQATSIAPAPAPEAETEAGGKFPIVITRKEITDLIQKQSSEKLEKMLKQAGINDFSGDKLKQMIARQNLLPLFDEYLNDSDVGDYFRLEGRGEVKEQIDIKKVFGARSGREAQILTFAFGVFLRAYIAKETKRLLSQGIEIPEEKLAQLNKSVINLSKKSLQNALKSSIKKPAKSREEQEPEDDQQRDDEQDGEETEEKETKFSNNEVSLSRDDTIEGLAMKIIGVKEKPTQRSDEEKFRELSFVRRKVMDIFKQAARNTFGNKVKIRTITEKERTATLSGEGYENSPSTSISKFAAEMLGLKEVPKTNKGDKEQYRKFSTAANKLKIEILSLLKKEFGLKNTYTMEEGKISQDPLLERWQRIAGINTKKEQ